MERHWSLQRLAAPLSPPWVVVQYEEAPSVTRCAGSTRRSAPATRLTKRWRTVTSKPHMLPASARQTS